VTFVLVGFEGEALGISIEFALDGTVAAFDALAFVEDFAGPAFAHGYGEVFVWGRCGEKSGGDHRDIDCLLRWTCDLSALKVVDAFLGSLKSVDYGNRIRIFRE